ncbi:SDR family NAD(P)-dependent oxidoreductase [Algoriphagus marinus]|uniref:SDR family NAD(P)-dependent oxidoreductase n=1 Tax=Algoriphagus marinus TaxID=1925762 RepID=UPI00094BB969|nr:SDR family NAD(P)-dependent oxidoreductase [Algoriphagus marinus]
MNYKVYTETNCIITGAASGIGLELVRQITPSNPNLLLVDIDEQKLVDLKKKFPQVKGIISVDLSQKNGNEQIFDWVKTNWTHVDFCFANAGKAEYGPAENQNWKEMDRLFQLNVHSPIQIGFMVRELFPQKSFRLIITASAMSYWHIPGYSLYAATKSALLQWARTIWSEKTGDWVTLAFPISTETNFFDTAGHNIPKAYPRQTAAWVAKTILSGTAKRKKKIFPSKLFLGMLILTRFFRFLKTGYGIFEYQKYKNWLQKQTNP